MYFEEFAVGQTFRLKPVTVARHDMVAYARAYDPQPIHIDPHFAETEGPFGTLIASGFYTVGLVWRQWIDLQCFGREIIAGSGLDFLTWDAPVRPGDTLSATVEIVETRPSSKPGRGQITFKFTVVNQEDTGVLTMQGKAYLKSKS